MGINHEEWPTPEAASDEIRRSKRELLQYLLGRKDLTPKMITPGILEAAIDDIVRKSRQMYRRRMLTDKDLTLPSLETELESAKVELILGDMEGSGLLDRILASSANTYTNNEAARRLNEMCDAIILKKKQKR